MYCCKVHFIHPPPPLVLFASHYRGSQLILTYDSMCAFLSFYSLSLSLSLSFCRPFFVVMITHCQVLRFHIQCYLDISILLTCLGAVLCVWQLRNLWRQVPVGALATLHPMALSDLYHVFALCWTNRSVMVMGMIPRRVAFF